MSKIAMFFRIVDVEWHEFINEVKQEVDQNSTWGPVYQIWL